MMTPPGATVPRWLEEDPTERFSGSFEMNPRGVLRHSYCFRSCITLALGGGLVLIRRVHQTFPGLPIIAIVESPKADIIERAEEFGAVEILKKPITPEWRPVVERVRATASRT